VKLATGVKHYFQHQPDEYEDNAVVDDASCILSNSRQFSIVIIRNFPQRQGSAANPSSIEVKIKAELNPYVKIKLRV
jgi:hypothetical protein